MIIWYIVCLSISLLCWHIVYLPISLINSERQKGSIHVAKKIIINKKEITPLTYRYQAKMKI